MTTTRFSFRHRAALLAALLAFGAAAPAASAQSRRSSRSGSSRRVAVKQRKVDWPNPTKAKRALSPKNFKKNIVDPALASSEVVAIENGREAFALGGAFGTVFKVMKAPGRFIAFRVFHPDSPSSQAALESGKVQRRYKKLEKKFDSLQKANQLPPELVDFEYISRGYKVGKRTFPALKMPWLTAQPLDSWMRGRLDGGKPEALKIMARNWRRAMMDLDTAGVAHGDLRDANVLVEGDGTMRFVDYDAMYTEELAGEPNSELGHPNYQHPAYHNGDGSKKRVYNRSLDHFSSLVIYLSLIAVADDPGLWERYNDDFQLIFSKEDLADPDNSPVFQELAASKNATVKKLAGKLAAYAKGPADQVPSLEEAIGGRARKAAFGRRETGGLLVDERVSSEAGGDPMLARRLGLRSRRALGSARTGESVRSSGSTLAAGLEEGNGAGEAPAARRQSTRAQSQRVASARARSVRGESRFAQVVPTIEGTLPRVSSGNPGLLLVLTDNSSSMGQPFAGQSGITKSQALAEVVNQTLADLVGRFRSGDRVKDTMDVSALSYSGDYNVRPALDGPLAGREIVSLPELAAGTNRIIDDVDENGEPFSQPVWVEPRAGGRTPMTRGFGQARTALRQWRQQRKPSKEHLVLAVHVTDGESTDGDPGGQIAALAQEVQAQSGKLLLTNIHLSSSGDPDAGVIFPTEADAARFDAFGKRLFEQSSVVPESLRQKLNRMGKNIPRGARMMAYNANVDDLAFLFEAGSSTAIE